MRDFASLNKIKFVYDVRGYFNEQNLWAGQRVLVHSSDRMFCNNVVVDDNDDDDNDNNNNNNNNNNHHCDKAGSRNHLASSQTVTYDSFSGINAAGACK